MTRHDDSSATRRLRHLDAADRELSPTQRARAAVTLERILATDPASTSRTTAPERSARRRPRLLLVAGGVAAALISVVVVPTVTGDSEAFASWSATPVELRGAERTAALEACLVLQSGNGGELALDPGAPGSALVAEARGGWNYVLFTVVGVSGRGLHGSCLVPDGLVADPRPGGGGFFGGLSGAEEVGSQPPAAVVRQDTYGVGSVDEGTFVYAEGRAGADVTSIDVTTPSGTRVEASIDDGHWAVWWPVRDESPRSPDMREGPTYEVTRRDGTVTTGLRTPR